MGMETNKKRAVFFRLINRCLLALAFLSGLPFQSVLADESINIAVLYPESNPAYTRLYQTIIDGMHNSGSATVNQYQFSKQPDIREINNWLYEKQAQAVIVLGKAGIQLSLELELDIPVITGAHILAYKNRSGVSLAADPVQMFRKLKQLGPKVRRVFVIHSEKNTGWLINQAALAARKQGLQLESLKIENMQDLRLAIESILAKLQKGSDAIWLPLDPAVPTRLVLPKLLTVAWQKELIIFGNNPIDVKKGILFAMYPDYTSMGKQLLAMARSRISKTSKAQPEASVYLKTAVNNRTASHLGITLNLHLLEQINLLYPRR